jgi:hypothetical protein
MCGKSCSIECFSIVEKYCGNVLVVLLHMRKEKYILNDYKLFSEDPKVLFLAFEHPKHSKVN